MQPTFITRRVKSQRLTLADAKSNEDAAKWVCTNFPNLVQTVSIHKIVEPPSQQDHADALGVQSRGGGRGNQYQSINAISTAMVPSQEDHTEAP